MGDKQFWCKLNYGKPAGGLKGSVMTERDLLAMGELDGLVGYQLRRAFLRSNQAFARVAGKAGFAPGQYGVMILVRDHPGRSQTEIAAAAGLDRSSLAQMLDQLEARGWVERRSGPDRRTVSLHATPAGVAACAAARPHVQEHERLICAGLNTDEVRRLIDLLKRLAG
jgi:DNA-binding MarR family transcriptional regulator